MSQARVLVVVLMLAGVPAHATNTWVANCENLKDPAMQTQIGVCTNHPGCRLFLESRRDCATANEFLNKLTVARAGRQTITSSNVFEAAAPTVNNDPEFTSASRAIKLRFDKQPGNVVNTGVNESKSSTWIFKGPWVYEGPIVNGQRHGVGVIIDGEGRLFRGEFVQGRQVGKGEYIDTGKNKRHAVGDSQEFDLHGNGILRRTLTGRISGQFKDGRPHGRITQVSFNGGRYDGEYVNGKRHGRGTEISPNGQRYQGEYADGRRHGQGTYTFPSGQQYVGEFANGDYHGQGTLTLPNGQRYQGEFANGNYHGQGTLTFPSGQRYQGEFANRNYHGRGTLTLPSGARYVGSHVDGNRFNGTLTNANGEVLAVYVDGNKQGSGATPDNAAQQAANDQQQAAAAEQERKAANRRARKEAWSILKPVVDVAASRNPDKARRLATAEALATKPANGENRVSTALSLYADSLARRSGTSNPSAPAGGSSRPSTYTQTSGTGNPGSGASYPSGTTGGAQGLPIAECKRQADAWPLKARNDALPKNETPLMMRGVIVWADFLIRTYRQCLPDPQAQQLIAQLETSRAQTLKVCQQISTNPDNCGISPF